MVPISIVDVLEMVYIEHQYREVPLVAHKAHEFTLCNVEKLTTCQTFCQRIDVRHVRHHLLGILLLDVRLERFAAIGLDLHAGCQPNDMHDQLCDQDHSQGGRIN